MDKKQEEKIQEEKNEQVEEAADIHADCKKLTQATEEKYKRALADYQNLQRRVQEEKGDWIKTSNKNLILKILPVLDTLMLAEKHTKDQNFTLTVQQFLSALEQEGVQRIKTIGELFDPHIMEAVGTVAGEEGKIIEEARAGFTMFDSALRSAQVIVGKKEEKEKIVN